MKYFEKTEDPATGTTLTPVSGNTVRTRVNVAPSFQAAPTHSAEVPSRAPGHVQVALAAASAQGLWPMPSPEAIVREPPVLSRTPRATPALDPRAATPSTRRGPSRGGR